MTTMLPIKMKVGNTHYINVQAVDGKGAALDITGSAISWEMAQAVDATPEITKTLLSGIVITRAFTGKFTITLNPSDTAALTPGTYYHECKITLQGGEAFTLFSGPFEIEAVLIDG